MTASPACFLRQPLHRALRCLALLGGALLLSGCAVGVGVGIPLVPGLALNVGVGPGGPSVGLSTGWGPLGAGVGFDARGRVLGSTGVGASAGLVGVGIGQSVVLHDPQRPPEQGVEAGVVVPSAPAGPPIEAP